MMRKITAAVIGFLAFTDAGFAQMRPAPDGESAVIAQRIIMENFDPPDCPLVIQAVRLGDGSIKALCNNRETYRIFSVNSKNLAMRCSVANKLGAGC
jgi:hypothetical protein